MQAEADSSAGTTYRGARQEGRLLKVAVRGGKGIETLHGMIFVLPCTVVTKQGASMLFCCSSAQQRKAAVAKYDASGRNSQEVAKVCVVDLRIPHAWPRRRDLCVDFTVQNKTRKNVPASPNTCHSRSLLRSPPHHPQATMAATTGSNKRKKTSLPATTTAPATSTSTTTTSDKKAAKATTPSAAAAATTATPLPPSRIDAAQASKAVQALLQHYAKHQAAVASKKGGKQDLLASEAGDYILVQVALAKIPERVSPKPVPIRLPHPLHGSGKNDEEEHAVCLIVKEDDKAKVKKALAVMKMEGVSEVVGLQELRTDYKEFQERRKLRDGEWSSGYFWFGRFLF